MPPITIRSPPSLDSYTPLSEYQSQTPETFHGGKPVLYYHATGAKAWIRKAQRGSLPVFPADSNASAPTEPEGTVLNGDAEELVEEKVDLFVNSENLTIFSPNSESGVSIPYPSITLHATKTIGTGDETYLSVYMQLELSDGGADDETFETVDLTIIPPAESTSLNPPAEDGAPTQTETEKLFKAISECSNLNPDPVNEDDEEDFDDDCIVFEGDANQEAIEGFSGVFRGAADGGLPPPMPGSSGWITADNVHEYFDADGNWIGEDGVSGELGEGAGRVRDRDEAESDGVNGHGADVDADNKRPRTE